MAALELRDLIGYVDTETLEWEEIAPGARRKTLYNDPETGQRVRLVQWDAGYSLPVVDEHPHGEYLFILEGTFVDQNQASGAGTYIHNLPGSSHQPNTPDGVKFLAFIPGRPDATA